MYFEYYIHYYNCIYFSNATVCLMSNSAWNSEQYSRISRLQVVCLDDNNVVQSVD